MMICRRNLAIAMMMISMHNYTIIITSYRFFNFVSLVDVSLKTIGKFVL